MKSFRLAALFAWLIGAATLIALFAAADLGAVLGAILAMGWGLVAVLAFHALPLLLDVLGWRGLFVAAAPSLWTLSWIRWVGEGANSLLPVAQIGGELIRARLARIAGADNGEAGATVIVDVTLGVVSQALFVALALALLGLDHEGSGLALSIGVGMGVIAIGIGVFYLLQRAALFGRLTHALAHRIGWLGQRIDVARVRALDAAIDAIYRRPRAVLAATSWRLAGWIVSAGEVWLAMQLLGHPLTLAEAIIIESLSQAARSAAFALPGGLGVQEGAVVLVAGHFGVPTEIGLALSLVKRFREIGLGAPALLYWQMVESRRWA